MNDSFEYLKKSPIFAMSLGAKELFHSNFWAWLIETEDEFAKVFFEGIDCAAITAVQREHKNMDLEISINNKKFIVENKLKSMATIKQLDKYEAELGGSFYGGVLTGISCTLDMSKVNGWKFISYEQIADRIESIVNRIDVQHKDIICQYCEVIRHMYFVLSNHLIETENIFDFEAGLDLKYLRIADLYKKLKASDFIENTIKSSCEIMSFETASWIIQEEVELGFSRSDAIIDLVFINKKALAQNEDLKLKIQLQSDQLRLGVHKGGRHDVRDIYNEYIQNGWFHEVKGKQIMGFQSRMKGDFCKYQASDGLWTFVYQYVVIQKNQTYEDVLEMILAFIDTIKFM